MTATPLRLDLIIRTSKRKKDARSPQQQRDMADSCAQTNGYEIVHVHDSGTDESGKTMDRRSIHAAMERVRAGDTDGVMVALADRIGRAPIEEAMTTVRAFCTAGKLVLADMGGQPLDLNNGVEESNVVFQLQMARQFWLNTANRFRRSQTDAVKAGKYVASAPPGFDKVSGRLVPNADAKVLHAAFSAAGSGSLRPAQALLRRHWPEGRWDVDRVRKLLRSPAYKGWSVSGELVNRKAHDPIVSEREWELAQVAARSRRENGCYPLSGIACHAETGAPLDGQLQAVRGRTYRRLRAPGCTVTATDLEDHILGVLMDSLADADFRSAYVPGDLEAAERTLRLAQQRRTAYVTKTDPLDPDYETGRAVHDRALAAAQAAYDEIATTAARYDLLPAPDRLPFDRDELGHPLAAVAFQQALAITIERIDVRPGRGKAKDRVVQIHWRGGR